MAKLPYMKFFPSDFIADTGHLTAQEIGAYIRLICHYWLHNGLPTDDRRLAQISGIDPRKWPPVRDELKKLFGPNWTHKRIESEIEKANDKSEKRRAAVNTRYTKEPTNVATNVDTNVGEMNTYTRSQKPETSKAPNPEKEEIKDTRPAASDGVDLFDTAMPVGRDGKPYAFAEGIVKLNRKHYDDFLKAYDERWLNRKLIKFASFAERNFGKAWFNALPNWLDKEFKEEEAHKAAGLRPKEEVAGRPRPTGAFWGNIKS